MGIPHSAEQNVLYIGHIEWVNKWISRWLHDLLDKIVSSSKIGHIYIFFTDIIQNSPAFSPFYHWVVPQTPEGFSEESLNLKKIAMIF